MAADRVKIQDIIASQLPTYVREDFPLLGDFLQQYYVSQEFEGATYDLIQNLDQYVKVDELFDLTNSTVLASNVSYTDRTITADVSGSNYIVSSSYGNGSLVRGPIQVETTTTTTGTTTTLSVTGGAQTSATTY